MGIVRIESLKITFSNQYIVAVSNECLLSSLMVPNGSQKYYCASAVIALVCAAEERELQGAVLSARLCCLLQLSAAGNIPQQWLVIFPGHVALFFLADTMGRMPRAPPLTCSCTRRSHQTNQ